MNDRAFDLLMVIVGAIAAKAIDEAVELAKRKAEEKKDSKGEGPEES